MWLTGPMVAEVHPHPQLFHTNTCSVTETLINAGHSRTHTGALHEHSEASTGWPKFTHWTCIHFAHCDRLHVCDWDDLHVSHARHMLQTFSPCSQQVMAAILAAFVAGLVKRTFSSSPADLQGHRGPFIPGRYRLSSWRWRRNDFVIILVCCGQARWTFF